MSRGAGYLDQVVELDFQYPSEGIHKRWDGGYRITALASTPDQARSSRRRRWPHAPLCVRSVALVLHRRAEPSLAAGWCAPVAGPSEAGRPHLPAAGLLPRRGSLLNPPPPSCLLQSAFVLSIPRRAMSDETQETLRTSTFPSGARRRRAQRASRPARVAPSAPAAACSGNHCRLYGSAASLGGWRPCAQARVGRRACRCQCRLGILRALCALARILLGPCAQLNAPPPPPGPLQST